MSSSNRVAELEQAKRIYREILIPDTRYSTCLAKVPLVLCGTKVDLVSKASKGEMTSRSDVRLKATQWLVGQDTHSYTNYFEVSAFTNTNVLTMFDWMFKKSNLMFTQINKLKDETRFESDNWQKQNDMLVDAFEENKIKRKAM